MAHIEFDTPEEASETEYLDQSLSVWKGIAVDADISYYCDHFEPITLDLHTACSIGHFSCVEQCIKRRVNIDDKNKGGWTPLMYASYIGHDQVVRLLLESGACVNIKNNKGQAPLCLAASCGNCYVSELLLQKGADVDACDVKGWTALFHATFSGHHNMVQVLLKNRAKIDAVEPLHGMTPLMEASAAGHETIVQYFLQYGVNVHARSHFGETALTLAKLNGHTKIINLLNSYMKKVNSNIPPQGSRDASSKNKFPGDRPYAKDVSITEGPKTLQWLMSQAKQQHQPQSALNVVNSQSQRDGSFKPEVAIMRDYQVVEKDRRRWRSGTSANEDDDDEEDDGGFSRTGVETIKSSSGSSNGLLGLGIERCQNTVSRDSRNQIAPEADDSSVAAVTQNMAALSSNNATSPCDLRTLLSEIGLAKYTSIFEEQDVDFEMFLTLTDDDLKQIGIKLLGPRRKMTAAITCLNSGAQDMHSNFEQVYSNTVEQLKEAKRELENVSSQLMQETQLRAVAESCVMEERLLWQQATAAAADTSLRCVHLHEILNVLGHHCDELVRRLSLDCLQDNAIRPSSRVELLSCSDMQVPLITLVNRLQYIKEELCQSVSVIAATNEIFAKRSLAIQSQHVQR